MEVVSILGEMNGRMNFEETELRLGLPGNISKVVKNNNIHVTTSSTNVNGKRGFAETTNTSSSLHVDLKLNLVSARDVKIMDQVAEPKEVKNLLGDGGSKDSVVKPPSK